MINSIDSNYPYFDKKFHAIESTLKIQQDCLESLKQVNKIPTQTPATMGLSILSKLKSYDKDFTFTPNINKERFFSEEESSSLKNEKDEHTLVQVIQNRLQQFFPTLAVVSSEIFPWLVTEGQSQKPDLFICPIPYYAKRVPRKEVKNYPPNYRYGIVADTRLYESVVLLDCKCNMNNTALGELSMHMGFLSFYSKKIVRGMLFGCDGFWLYEQERDIAFQRIQANYSDEGSLELIKNFFQPILYKYTFLDDLCHQLEVEFLDPMAYEDNDETYKTGFLGQGGYGKVIKVLPRIIKTQVSGDEENMMKKTNSKFESLKISDKVNYSSEDIQAMKIVDMEYITIVNHELDKLLTHRNNCGCDLIVTPLSDKLAKNEVYCGYVMQPVGISTSTKLLQERSTITIADMLFALYRLHIHEPMIIHGDPRLQNLLYVPHYDKSNNISSYRLFWVDLMVSVIDLGNPVHSIMKDMTTLVTSIIGDKQCNSEEITSAIEDYSNTIKDYLVTRKNYTDDKNDNSNIKIKASNNEMNKLNCLVDKVASCFFMNSNI